MSKKTKHLKEPCREKYWEELKTEEKIERMRKIIKMIQSNFKFLDNSVKQLENHNHLDGEIVVPKRCITGASFGGTLCSTINDSDNVFF